MSMRIDGTRRPSGAGGARGSRTTRTTSIASMVAPKPTQRNVPSIASMIAPPRQQTTGAGMLAAQPAPTPAPVLGGGGGGGGARRGGGGGGSAAAMVAPAGPAMSLEDFIQNHFLKKQTENEMARALEDFDAETMRMQQETEADMALRQQDLQRDLDDAGLENAGSFAARGLDRSGLVFQAQDRINAEGQQRGRQIQEMLTSLLGDRGRGRIQQQRQGEALLNQRIAELTRQFNEQNQAPLAV